jgi:methionyl-tRNA formyltransferase
MRLVFAGTPAPAVPSLRRLAASDHEIAAVITRPDAPLGRKRVLTPSPVAAAAEELGIRVIRAARLDEDATGKVAALAPDLGVIVAYGGIVRAPLLSTPRHGWINLHFSLLPAWRGAAPVQHALIAGDRVTGASVFQLVPALDAGDLYGELRYEVPAAATAADVLTTLAESGAGLLTDVVDDIANGTATARPQTGEPTFAPKLTIADGALDWTQPAGRVLDRCRGVTPEPGAHTTVGGLPVKVLAAEPAPGDVPPLPAGRIAATRGGILIGTATTPVLVTRVQPSGKAAMAAADWWRGLRIDDPAAGA